MPENEKSEEKPEESKETSASPTPVNPRLAELNDTIDRLEKAKAEAKSEADRLMQLKEDALLSGTAGVRPEIQAAKEESATELLVS